MIVLILQLGAVGFVTWLLITLVPMPDPVKKIIIAAVAILLVLYLVTVFGLDVPVSRLHGH